MKEEIEGPRGTRPEEYEKTLALAQSIFQGADLARDFSLEWNPDNCENLRILLVNGEPIAHVGFSQREACILGNRVTLGLIGGVCCHPDYRNRGFAGACLQDAIAQLTRRGVSLMPVSGRRTLYFRHHCACAGIQYHATLSRSQLPARPPQGLSVRPYSREMLDDLIRLYQQEPIRYLRSREVMATLMERGPTEVVCLGDRPVAYAKSRGVEQAEDGSRRLGLYELTGPRELLVAALPALVEREKLDGLVLAPLYGTDTAIRWALAPLGVTVERSEWLAGTVRVVNFPLLMEQMAPYFRERLGKDFERLIYYEQDGKFVFGLGRERFELPDRTALALFLFGPQRSQDAIEPPPGPLGELLQAVFPMPYVFPGNDNV
jgi:predicted N-acetyltransferase YhbS